MERAVAARLCRRVAYITLFALVIIGLLLVAVLVR